MYRERIVITSIALLFVFPFSTAFADPALTAPTPVVPGKFIQGHHHAVSLGEGRTLQFRDDEQCEDPPRRGWIRWIWDALSSEDDDEAAVPTGDPHGPRKPRRAWISKRRGPWCDNGMIHDVAVHPRLPLVVAAGRRGRSHDGFLKLYDLKSGKLSDCWLQHAGTGGVLQCIAASRDGTRFAAGNRNGDVTIWRLAESEGPTSRASLAFDRKWSLDKNISAVCFSPDDDTLVAGTSTGRLILMAVDGSAAPRMFPKGTAGSVSRIAWGPDKDIFATAGGASGSVTIWSLAERRALRTLERGRAFVTDLAFLPSGGLLAAYGDAMSPFESQNVYMEFPKEQLRFWDCSTGESNKHWQVEGDRVESVSLSPDGRLLAVGCGYRKPRNRGLVILDASSGDRIVSVEGRWHSPLVRWWGDRHTLIACDGHEISCWDLRDAAAPRRLWYDTWRRGDDAMHFDP